MQYHARALAATPADVDLVGRGGSEIHPGVADHPHIRLHLLRPRPPRRLPRPFDLASAGLRVIGDTFVLLWVLLFVVRRPDVILVQNPPAIPTLLVAWLAARARAARLVVDWHNFGYTMLSLRVGQRHPAVRIARWYERALGRRADAHLCVSRAMQSELAGQWGIGDAVVLHDRPPDGLAPTPLHLRHDLFRRLQDEIGSAGPPLAPSASRAAGPGDTAPSATDAYREDTLATTVLIPRNRLRDELQRYCARDGSPPIAPPVALLPFVRLRPDRPALIVSPTSWTEDEDFDLMLDAARRCDEAVRPHAGAAPGRPFPQLLILITGQGPLRERYQARMNRLTLGSVHLRPLWLSPQDYALLLGAADLGLCLHRSSSKLDLPMKVADMFGAGLPVCALDYGPCLAEQVRHGENGLLFKTSTDLAQQLVDLFRGFPDDQSLLARLREHVAASSTQRWSEGWAAAARPVFLRGAAAGGS